jgi:tripartite-type tricarboxylate transporter receptor subunit TctC
MISTLRLRRGFAVLGIVLLVLLQARPASAQGDFPSRPIDIVTHASPGGGTDATARSMVVGAKLALDVDMAVVPRTGGGGIVAMNYVWGRPRDGYTVLAITPTHLFAIARGQGPIKIEDLVPVARSTDDPIVVMVRHDSDVQTLVDLIELGKQRPIKWGTTQIGGVDHVAGAVLAQKAGTQLSVVPFSGGGEIVTNLMGGSVDAAGLNLTEALDQIRRGDFRALAVMAEERLASIPDVPTTVELGYDVVFSTVRGYLVLKGTPQDRIEILERGMLEGMRQQNYQDYLRGSGLDSSSIAGREAWGAQVARLYADAHQAMIDLGIIRER